MADEEPTQTQNDTNKTSTSITVEERLNSMQKQIDTMNHEITELNSALRNKSFMITKLSTELEKLKTRMDKNEKLDIEQAVQIREMEEKEIKEEMDKMPLPDLTVKQTDENDNKESSPTTNKKKKTYRGYLLLWSGSTGYANEQYNKIQLLNLKKYKETNGKQKPYIFYLENMENKFFNKKNIQFQQQFDRHWFGGHIVTNNDTFPRFIQSHIDKLNYNPLNNEYIKKMTTNLNSFQQKWNLKKFSLKNLTAKDTSEDKPVTESVSPKSPMSPKIGRKKDSHFVFDVSANFSMIFRCGGVYSFNKQRCADCDVTIFNHLHDNNIINGYTLNLPSLPITTSLTSSIYNTYNGVLYCIGGDTDSAEVTDSIYELNLNTTDEIPKWKKGTVKLYTKRKCANLCLIDQHNLMVIGGKSKSGEKLNSVELYVNTATDFDIEINRYKTTKLLAPLCLPRSASGCLLFNESDKRVIIGGGWGGFNNDDTKKTVEWYDAVKNKWFLFPYKTNFEHQFCPILWNDKYNNPNVIYIGGDCIGIDSKSMLGQIEWIDIRENKNDKKWNMFKDDKSLEQMFLLQNTDEKIWRSRALMIS